MLHYRLAAWDDREWLLACRNDPVTRANSLQQGEVTRAEHEAWLARSLTMTERCLLIIEREQRQIGVLRFDQCGDDVAEVSIHLAPEARKLGYGQTVLRESLVVAARWNPAITALLAQIKRTNGASLHSFRRAGFVTIEETEALVWMKKENRSPDECGSRHRAIL